MYAMPVYFRFRLHARLEVQPLPARGHSRRREILWQVRRFAEQLPQLQLEIDGRTAVHEMRCRISRQPILRQLWQGTCKDDVLGVHFVPLLCQPLAHVLLLQVRCAQKQLKTRKCGSTCQETLVLTHVRYFSCS